MMPDQCPDCRVDLDDDGTRVWCFRCGWEIRDVDNPVEYHDRSDAVAEVGHA